MRHGFQTARYEDIATSKELEDFFQVIGELFGIQFSFAPLELKNRTTWPAIRPQTEDSPLCLLIHSVPEGQAACIKCDKSHCATALTTQTAQCYICHAGMIDILVPVSTGGRVVGVLLGGQLLPEPPSTTGFLKLRTKLKGIPIEKKLLRTAYFKMPHIAMAKAKSLVKLVGLFSALLDEKGFRVRRRNTRSMPPFIKNGIAYMATYFRDSSLSLEQVANSASISVSHLGRCFKKYNGVTFNHFLLNFRLGEAEKLLRSGGMRISDIALQSGFGSISHFNRVFKDRFLLSPRQYMKIAGSESGHRKIR